MKSQRLMARYLGIGGSLAPDLDAESPFWSAEDLDGFAREMEEARKLAGVSIRERKRFWHQSPDSDDVQLWLHEMLTPELLVEVAQLHEEIAQTLAAKRPLLMPALLGEIESLGAMLTEEIEAQKAADRRYWGTLKARLAHLRRSSREEAGIHPHD